MILSELKLYLQQRGQAPLSDIAVHFDVDAAVARGMLQVWMKKGKVQCLQTTPACGSSCTQCAPESTEIYVWGNAVQKQNHLQQSCTLR
jgi:hypothetical protein